MAIKVVSDNPFRILGVFSNSTVKEIVSSANKLKAYIKVGQNPETQVDFKSLLPPIERTIENINAAQSHISIIEDKIKYSLFWFIKDSPIDEIALGHLNANNISKSKEILNKQLSYSALLNLGLISLCENNLESSIKFYHQLINDYHHRSLFFQQICDSNSPLSDIDLSHIFYDTLIAYYPINRILDILKELSFIEDYNYVKSLAAAESINAINAAIAIAKNANKAPNEQLKAGKKLQSDTKAHLHLLKQLIGNEDQYQIVADNLAKQILQCGINYYNNSSDINKAEEAFILQNDALSIAVGTLVKERCKENVDILAEVLKNQPPEEVREEATSINNLLDTTIHSNCTIKMAIQLIINCAPHLASIKLKLGPNGNFYRKISTTIEEFVLSVTIKHVNKVLEGVKTSYYIDPVQRTIVQNTLEDAWEATLYMDELDIDDKAKARFNAQKDVLNDIMLKAGVYPKPFVCFKIETELEIYNHCTTKLDYEKYINRFPNGKFVDQARIRIAEINKREQEEKRNLKSLISNARTFQEAISLLPKCKENDTRIALDERCFSLCKSKSDFKKYLEAFRGKAEHASEAESHLKLDRKIEQTRRYIKDHSVLIIIITIFIVITLGVGLIWGLSGYAAYLRILGFIFGFAAFGYLHSGEGKGCLYAILLALLCALFMIGGDKIDDYCREQKKLIEAEKAYNKILTNPTEEECASFINKYPKSPHYNEIMDLYFAAAEKNGVKALYSFANRFKKTTYGAKASNRLNTICDSLYNIADKKETIEAWRDYQKIVPVEFLKDSYDKIETIENKAWNTEAKAWKLASNENTLRAYKKYLQLYPNGAHKNAANKKVIDLQVADIFAGEHGELPSMDHTGYGGGTTSTISIFNNTSYTMTILYSGTDSKEVIISPHQTRSVTLKNGTYRIAASVNSSNVRSFAGSESLRGGTYDVEYYIVTTRY